MKHIYPTSLDDLWRSVNGMPDDALVTFSAGDLRKLFTAVAQAYKQAGDAAVAEMTQTVRDLSAEVRDIRADIRS